MMLRSSKDGTMVPLTKVDFETRVDDIFATTTTVLKVRTVRSDWDRYA
jgi:hypothetical protein